MLKMMLVVCWEGGKGEMVMHSCGGYKCIVVVVVGGGGGAAAAAAACILLCVVAAFYYDWHGWLV